MNDFMMNGITIKTLLLEKRGDRAYYEGLLSNLRRLLVYCEEGMDACHRIVQNERFERNHAERILYKIYHNASLNIILPDTSCGLKMIVSPIRKGVPSDSGKNHLIALPAC